MGESGTRLAAILVQMQSRRWTRITLVVSSRRCAVYLIEVLVLEVTGSYLPLPNA
jgi:hypothetical protein